MEKFKELKVWQKAHQLVLEIYKITKSFPGDEKFCLVQQMKRAAISIPANIAEGTKRKGQKNRSYFHNIADTSLEELKYYLLLSLDLNYINNTQYEKLLGLAREIGAMLRALDESLKA